MEAWLEPLRAWIEAPGGLSHNHSEKVLKRFRLYPCERPPEAYLEPLDLGQAL